MGVMLFFKKFRFYIHMIFVDNSDFILFHSTTQVGQNTFDPEISSYWRPSDSAPSRQQNCSI